MEYISVVENTYEEAVNKAKSLYGDDIRIHSRRDFTIQGGLFTRRQKRCEIVCYKPTYTSEREDLKERTLKEFEEEAKTPDPSTLSLNERLETESLRDSGLERAKELLDINYITGPLREKVLENFSASWDNTPKALMERILKNIRIDYKSQTQPKKYMVLIGPTGTGKTTTCAKVSYYYKEMGKSVSIITLDSYRIGAYEQIKAFGDALNIPVDFSKGDDELILLMDRLKDEDLVMVDTMGISPRDTELDLTLESMTNQISREESIFVLILSPSMKEEDLIENYKRYSIYHPESIIATKVDESESIGNLLSFSYRVGLPILFLTDGQRVPEDLKKALSSTIVSSLKGFGLEIKRGKSQISETIR